jgi:hypothetical protein
MRNSIIVWSVISCVLPAMYPIDYIYARTLSQKVRFKDMSSDPYVVLKSLL